MAALAAVLYRDTGGAASRRRRLLDGASRGLFFGIGANVVALRFVPNTVATFTALPWTAGVVLLVLLAAAQGLRWAFAGALGRELCARGLPPWAAFAVAVYAGTFVPAVFPWTPAGGVTPVPEMAQLAELVGERGVTLVMALSAGLAGAAALRAVDGKGRHALLLALAALAVPLLTYAQGRAAIARVEALREGAPTAAVGLVQPQTAALERWDASRSEAILARLVSLTKIAEEQGAEVTVWPEAAYPYPVAHASRYCPVGARAVLPVGVRGPVLTGMITTGADGDRFNSAAVCATSGAMSKPYDKLRLLWFGETVPWLDRIPWVRRTFSRGTGLVPGDLNVVQTAGPVTASVLNCFEDTLPEAGREAMTDRPNLLVNLTNDAWFAGSSESELHLRLAALRAIESRRDLVRAVNMGPTSWIDAAGVVRARYATPFAGVILARPALLSSGPTLYDRTGDALTACGVILALLAWASWRRSRRTGRRQDVPA